MTRPAQVVVQLVPVAMQAVAGNVTYNKVEEIAAHLSADGHTLMPEPQGIWRLPTIDEAVRSLTRNGHNARGVWARDRGRAVYQLCPDKESPLWEPYSPVIYWWTQSKGPRENTRYGIAYNGYVKVVNERSGWASLGFRLVRNPVATQ